MIKQFTFPRKQIRMRISSLYVPGQFRIPVAMKTLLLLLITTMLAALAKGQDDITISLAVTPPYTSKIISYFDQPYKLILTIKNNNNKQIEAFIDVRVSNNSGLSVTSDPKFRRKLILGPREIFKMNQSNYREVIDVDHLVYNGITKDQIINGIIAEDEYTICISAFDAKNKLLSGDSPQGCATFPVKAVNPPDIIRPACGEKILPSVPQSITFSWSMPVGAPSKTEYKVKFVELMNGQVPIEAMERNPVFFEKSVSVTTYLYSTIDPILTPGQTYVFAVIAKDPDNKVNFRNNGMSEICRFTYGTAGTVVTEKKDTTMFIIELIAPIAPDSLVNIRPEFKWRTDKVLKDATYSLTLFVIPEKADPNDPLKNMKSIWTKGGITVPLLRYPMENRAIDSNKIYVWQVTATGLGGAIIGKSNFGAFTISTGLKGATKSCTCSLTAPVTAFSVCQYGSLTIPKPSLSFSGCSNSEIYSALCAWIGTLNVLSACWLTGPLQIDATTMNINTLVPTVYSIPYVVVGTGFNCSLTYTVKVYPSMDDMQILATSPTAPCNNPDDACNNLCPQITEICSGQEADLFIPGNCPGSAWYDPDVHWQYKDKSQYTASYGFNGIPWGTGNPRYTQTIQNPGLCGTTDNYFTRAYFAFPPASYPSTCASAFKELRVWCHTDVGNILPVPGSHAMNPGPSPNVYTICCSPNDFPIDFELQLQNQKGDVQKWQRNPGPDDFTCTPGPCFNNLGLPGSCCTKISTFIGSPGTYTYTVFVKNGTCEEKSTSVTIIVEEPFVPVLTSNKYLVCPNEDAEVSFPFANPPMGATIEWFYQVNCTGPWIPPPATVVTSQSNAQFTNPIGNLSPWYLPPISTPGFSSLSTTISLCWKAVVTSTICPASTSDPLRIDIRQGPGTPFIPPPPLLCCGTSCTLTATVPGITSNTGPLTYQWYFNDIFTPISGATQLQYTFICSKATQGDYFLVVTSPCKSIKSNVVHQKCCCVDISIDGPCCSDGITPITLTANATSTCGNAISTYIWTGANIASGQGTSQITLNPPPSYYPGNIEYWDYTVRVIDAMGCENSQTITIIACP
jgi:hypothetical protein